MNPNSGWAGDGYGPTYYSMRANANRDIIGVRRRRPPQLVIDRTGEPDDPYERAIMRQRIMEERERGVCPEESSEVWETARYWNRGRYEVGNREWRYQVEQKRSRDGVFDAKDAVYEEPSGPLRRQQPPPPFEGPVRARDVPPPQPVQVGREPLHFKQAREPLHFKQAREPPQPIEVRESTQPIRVRERPPPVQLREPPPPIQLREPPPPIQLREPPPPIYAREPPNPVQQRKPSQTVKGSELPQPIQEGEPPQPVQEEETLQPVQEEESLQPVQEEESLQPVQEEKPPQSVQMREPPKPIRVSKPVVKVNQIPEEFKTGELRKAEVDAQVFKLTGYHLHPDEELLIADTVDFIAGDIKGKFECDLAHVVRLEAKQARKRAGSRRRRKFRKARRAFQKEEREREWAERETEAAAEGGAAEQMVATARTSY